MRNRVFIAMMAFAMGTFVSEQPPQGLRRKAQQCCDALEAILTSSAVSYPGSPEYAAQSSTYYSLEQAAQRPACRISPTTTEDVALIMKLAATSGCEFAVRSGGQMSWEGSSNIGPEGFTIDLQGLKVIELHDEEKTVSIAPGLTWGEVYAFLKPHGLHTMGARASSVGVGGFLLGGGISFSSMELGFASDNVLDYETVLSNGSIVHANVVEHPDLFWALKGGSTNYGIVTRFLLPTMSRPQIWGGILTYPISAGPQLCEQVVRITNRLKMDPRGMMGFGISWNPATRTYIIQAPAVYLAPIAYPSPLFDGLRDIAPMKSTMRFADLGEITDEVDMTMAGSQYSLWFSLTVKVDAGLPWDIHLKGKEIFEPLHDHLGISWTVGIQPMNQGMFSAGQKYGGNPFGLASNDGDQLLMLGAVSWTAPEDSALVKAKTQEFLRASTDLARERGLFTKFVYANYALGTQHVLESYGDENIRKMRAVKEKYDPDDLLKSWKGGWKLFGELRPLR